MVVSLQRIFQHRSEQTVRAIIVVVVVSFLLYCLRAKLAADLVAEHWLKIGLRAIVVVVLGALVSWRLNPSEIPLTRLFSRPVLTLVIFLATLYYPLVSQYSNVSKAIEKTRQVLAEMAADSGRAKYHGFSSLPAEFESRLDQYFNLPQAFIHFNALIKVHILGVSPNNNVAIGKNGFYFEGWGARKVELGIVEKFDNIADYMGQIPFSQAQLRRWKQTLEERQYWLAQKGVPYVFVLAPTKALVYPEYLPARLQRIDKGTTRYQQLSEYLQNHTALHVIDLLPALVETKQAQPYPLLFYKTDFHWNFFGAFIAYQEIVNQLQQAYPELSFHQPRLDDFDLKINENWAHPRFLNMIGLPQLFHRNEHYLRFVPKPARGYDQALDLPGDGIHDVYPPVTMLVAAGNKPLKIRMIRNPGSPLSSMLLLGDSFFEKCVYFFSAQAKEVYNYRTIVNFPSHIFRYQKPDLVVQEILNMFLLRKPPRNPPQVATSYARSKYRDSRELVHFASSELTLSSASEGAGTTIVKIRLPGSVPLRVGEFRTAQITLSVPVAANCQISAGNEPDQGTETHHLEPGENRLYVLLSQATTDAIDLRLQATGAEISPMIDSVSIRTDVRP